MQGFTVHEVSPGLTVTVVSAAPALTPSLEAEVERLWQSAEARLAGVLFNGHVFSADAIEPERLSGHFTEFRRIVAQTLRPELFTELGLRPLAVNGIVRLTDGILIGRRSLRTAYQAGMWQLPPAGSVDPGAADGGGRIDLAAQLLKELLEETGIVAARSAVGAPLCIVEHPLSHVLDIGIPITLSLDAATALALHAKAGNGEYDPMRVVSDSELSATLAALGGTVVPSARIFLARVGLIPAPVGL
ncbi:MAG: NUDIX domain-containing protein [Acetobacteraceae bacterium]